MGPPSKRARQDAFRTALFFSSLAAASAQRWSGSLPPPPTDWTAASPPPPSAQPGCTSILNTAYSVQDPTATGAAVGQPAGKAWQPQWGVPFDGRKLPLADLQTYTSGQCNYIPDVLEDTFQTPDLNLNNWIPTGSYPYAYTNTYVAGNITTYNPIYASTGNINYKQTTYVNTPWGAQSAGGNQDHCPSAGAVGAASPSTCTFLNPQSLQLNATLPGYVVDPTDPNDNNRGAIMTLTQSFWCVIDSKSAKLTTNCYPNLFTATTRTAPTRPSAATRSPCPARRRRKLRGSSSVARTPPPTAQPPRCRCARPGPAAIFPASSARTSASSRLRRRSTCPPKAALTCSLERCVFHLSIKKLRLT